MLVTFLPNNIKIQTETVTNLFQIARENGIDLGGICSGNKTCGKCKVLITKGNTREFLEEERNALTEEELTSGIRLACCFLVSEDTCVILKENSRSKISSEVFINRSGRKADSPADTPSRNFKRADTKDGSCNPLSYDYGIALDIGTTSVAAELWNIKAGERLGQISVLNPQHRYGADVISRITYAMADEAHLIRLTELIRECCNNLVHELAKRHNIKMKNIGFLAAAANTTMSHLFSGRPVDLLSKVPFTGVSYDSEVRKPSDMGIDINPDGCIYIMPGIGGHVGSDTLGCIIAAGLGYTKGPVLLVDIGTNGEIVLAEHGNITVCSTAAGPAFEGASLYQGMRAVEGAITQVDIKQGKITVDYIGSDNPDIKPAGICGSGIIEAVSELYRNGIMDATGRLSGEAGNRNYISLWEEKGKEVRITQKDIRELQLAKGAISAGMKILLKKQGIGPEDVDKIYLAGAFGSSVNLQKAVHIGLLPEKKPNQIEYMGNGSLAGAARLILGKISIREAERIGKSAKHLELALCGEFEEEFMNAVSFPKYKSRHRAGRK